MQSTTPSVLHNLIIEKAKSRSPNQDIIKRREFLKSFECFGIPSIYYSSVLKEMKQNNLIKIVNKRTIQIK